jgi:hypothetical protein
LQGLAEEFSPITLGGGRKVESKLRWGFRIPFGFFLSTWPMEEEEMEAAVVVVVLMVVVVQTGLHAPSAFWGIVFTLRDFLKLDLSPLDLPPPPRSPFRGKLK